LSVISRQCSCKTPSRKRFTVRNAQESKPCACHLATACGLWLATALMPEA